MFYVSFSIGIAVWEAPLALTAESISGSILYVLSLKRLFIFCLAHFFIICLMQSFIIRLFQPNCGLGAEWRGGEFWVMRGLRSPHLALFSLHWLMPQMS